MHPNPFPLRQKQGHWTFNQERLTWGTPNTTYNASTAIVGTHWRAGLFDLRYNLGDVDGFGQRRQKNIEQDVLFGINFYLFVDLDITFAAGSTAAEQYPAFRWYCIEFGNAMDPNKVRFLQSRRDITTQVYAGFNPTAQTLTVSLTWMPTGPMRYWGLALAVDQINANDINGNPIAAPPTILVDAALH